MEHGRESRILDAAGDLLLAFGYRKVTIEDVARRAEIGKGTVYLHWSSKLDLFAAVLVREVVQLTAAHLATLRADPAEIQLHRTLRNIFLLVMRRPLARAFYTGDTELLGALSLDTKLGRQVRADKELIGPPYLAALHAHGMLLDDPATDPSLPYRLSASTAGFFLLERMLPDTIDVEAKADALAVTVRRAFEPLRPPSSADVAAAAPVITGLYEQMVTDLTRPRQEQP